MGIYLAPPGISEKSISRANSGCYSLSRACVRHLHSTMAMFLMDLLNSYLLEGIDGKE